MQDGRARKSYSQLNDRCEVKKCPNKESELARGHGESGLNAPESQTH